MARLAKVLVLVLAVALIAQACVAADDEGAPPRRGPRAGQGDGPRRPGGPDGPGPGPGGPGEQTRRPMFRPHPLMVALDKDHNGELSAEEIAAAPEALKKLDKNKDGKIGRAELQPPRPAGGPGEKGGGQDGPRKPGGPGGDGQDGPRKPGGPGGPDPAQFLRRMMSFDKNGDKKLSKDELPERMQRIFDRADQNKDGFLDEAELKELAKRLSQGGRPRPGGPGQGQGPPPGPGGEGGQGDAPRPRRPQRPPAEK